MPLEKVTFKNCYKNSPQFLQEAAHVIGNGGTQFRQKVKNRTAFIASRELLQPEQIPQVRTSPKKPDVYASE